MTYTLYGRPRWGSTLVEAQLVWYGLPFTYETVGDLLRDPASRTALEKVNPLAQVPTLVIGARHDTMDPAFMEMMAGRLPHGSYLYCPDCSHMAMYDDQAVYFGGLIDFLHGLG